MFWKLPNTKSGEKNQKKAQSLKQENPETNIQNKKNNMDLFKEEATEYHSYRMARNF